MFDQTFITIGGKRRPWTYLLGLSAELLALGFMMLLPLIYTEQLSVFGFAKVPIQIPRGKPAPPPKFETAGRQMVHSARPFVLTNTLYRPVSIPAHPAMLVDPIDAPQGAFVPGGIPGDGPGIPVGSRLGDPSVAPPPDKPRATEPKQAPPAAKTAPVRVGGDVQAAMIVRRVIPLYPQLAKQARVQGVVRLEGIIGKDGVIQQLHVVSGHPLLVPAAVEAVRQWVYRPTLLNGQPVEVQAPIDVTFTLAQ